MNITKRLKEAVTRGSEYLDEHHPGWYYEVDTARLDIPTYPLSRFVDWSRTFTLHTRGRPEDYGFSLPACCLKFSLPGRQQACNDLTSLWIRRIDVRRRLDAEYISEIVARGAALLDTHYPGWAERIDPSAISMRRGAQCISAKVTGVMYPDSLYKLGLTPGCDDGMRYGFTLKQGMNHSRNWDSLQACWKEEILFRQNNPEKAPMSQDEYIEFSITRSQLRDFTKLLQALETTFGNFSIPNAGPDTKITIQCTLGDFARFVARYCETGCGALIHNLDVRLRGSEQAKSTVLDLRKE